MRLLRTMVALFLALAWGPLTSHCRLASVAGFEAFRCHAAVPDSDEHSGGCDGCGCCALESAQYDALRPRETGPAGVPDFGTQIDPGPAPSVALAVEPGGILIAAPPPRRAGSWQFDLRAAPPVRAPSRVS